MIGPGIKPSALIEGRALLKDLAFIMYMPPQKGQDGEYDVVS